MKVELDAVTDENGYRVVSPEGTVYIDGTKASKLYDDRGNPVADMKPTASGVYFMQIYKSSSGGYLTIVAPTD